MHCDAAQLDYAGGGRGGEEKGVSGVGGGSAEGVEDVEVNGGREVGGQSGRHVGGVMEEVEVGRGQRGAGDESEGGGWPVDDGSSRRRGGRRKKKEVKSSEGRGEAKKGRWWAVGREEVRLWKLRQPREE